MAPHPRWMTSNRLCAHTCDVVGKEGERPEGARASAPGMLSTPIGSPVPPRGGAALEPPADEAGVAPGAAESATTRWWRVQRGPTNWRWGRPPPFPFAQTPHLLRGCPPAALVQWDFRVMGGGAPLGAADSVTARSRCRREGRAPAPPSTPVS